MNDDVRKKADEVFRAKMSELQGKSGQKSELAHMQAQSLGGFDLSSGSFCEQAPKIADLVQKQLAMFSWLIPDNIEVPAKALLAALTQVVLPAFCGTTASAPKPTVKTNVSQTAR